MGLSAMSDMPDMDQHLRFANIAGSTHMLAPNVWVGENSLHGLGFDDASSNTPNVINSIANGASQVIGAVGQLRGQKKSKTTPAPMTHPMMQATPTTDTGHSNVGKYVLVAGLAIGAAVLLYVVLHKKKKNDGGGI